MILSTETHGSHQHLRYRMDCAEFDRLIERAKDRCEICGVSGPESAHRRLFIDHNASLGKWAVRGLLCGTCNTLLGIAGPTNPAIENYFDRPWRTEADSHMANFDFRTGRYRLPPEKRRRGRAAS